MLARGASTIVGERGTVHTWGDSSCGSVRPRTATNARPLDGAIARATTRTDHSGFLDIALDFVVYSAIPLAFAIYDAHANALAAAFLLASFLANGSTFLAFSIMAEQRGFTTTRCQVDLQSDRLPRASRRLSS